MKKLVLLATILFMPLVVNATYSHDSYYGKHSQGNKNYSHKKHKQNKHYGNPLVGHKMPKGCKWVWVNGKKETKCGKKNHKMKLAKFCAKYPNSHKCKGKPPVTSVSEPTPLILLALGLFAVFLARRK